MDRAAESEDGNSEAIVGDGRDTGRDASSADGSLSSSVSVMSGD